MHIYPIRLTYIQKEQNPKDPALFNLLIYKDLVDIQT